MIRVRHTIDKLASDYEQIPIKAAASFPGMVNDAAKFGRDLAKALAKVESGPHGKHYWKRINAELTSPTSAEFGPDGSPKTEFVGAGYRSGANKDLEKAAGPAGKHLADDVDAMVRRLFR